MDVYEFNGRRLYTGLGLDHRLRLWAPTSALHAVFALAKLLVLLLLKVETPECVDLRQDLYATGRGVDC